jgi:protein-S-isoprenylcysteine O-methyltransferase Ste14
MNQTDIIRHLRDLSQYLWAVLVVVWLIGAFRTKRTIRRQSSSSRLIQIAVVAAGAYLLFARYTGIRSLDRPVIPITVNLAASGFALIVFGVGFSIWARLTLGANWSGTVTLKQDHALIQRGPYGLVRHPIYTGILAALIGSALERGLRSSLIALPLCGLGFWLKIKTEEQFMVQRFGEAYVQYKQKVKALVPFLF